MKKVSPIISILIFYLIFQIYLPGVAENQIEKNIINYVDEVEGLSVKASSFPAWKIITEDKLDHLEVKAESFIIDGLKFEGFEGKYQDVSYKDQIIKGENTDLYFYLTETSLNEYLQVKYPEFKNFDIDLKDRDVILNGKLEVFDSTIELYLIGDFKLNDINNIVYTPNEFKVEKLEIPVSLIKEITGDMSFSIDLSQYNIPIKVENLRLKEDRIELSGGSFVRKAG